MHITSVGPSPDDKLLYDLRDSLLVAGEVLRAEFGDVLRWASGKGANVARAVACMQEQARLLGFIGSEASDFFIDTLGRNGIECELTLTQTQTRRCITILGGGIATEIVQKAGQVRESEIEDLRRRFVHAAEKSDAFVFSGTLPAGCPETFYRELCKIARDAKPSKRPIILDASGAALLQALELEPDVVKPNKAELAYTFGAVEQRLGSAEVAALARRLVDGGAKYAVISSGKDSVTVVSERDQWQIHPAPIEHMTNTVGSGDAMAGGIALGLARALSIDEAVRLGMAMGAANAETLYPGDLQRAAVEAKLKVLRQ